MNLCFLKITCLRKISFPRKPKPHLARCSFKKTRGFFLLRAHSSFIQCSFRPGHGLQVTCSWQSNSPGTFHQSAARHASSGIIPAAEPARIGLYSAKANIYTLYTRIPSDGCAAYVTPVVRVCLISAHAHVKLQP